MYKERVDISDIFSSIQGEGLFVGAKQIFVRFKGCNLNCAYCDERSSTLAIPHSPAELLTEIKFLELSKGPHHSLSITGGEPLVYSEFLKVFLKLAKKEGFKNYLETNGTLPGQLAEVIDLVDIVAMDFKLPSSTGERAFWDEHKQFMNIASRAKLFIKAVITANTVKEDIEKAVLIIKEFKKDIPFVLQPASAVKAGDRMVDKDILLNFLEVCSKNSLPAARIIPQMHKIWNVK